MKRYVIGDIHGCYQELVDLLVRIDQHANNQPYKVIFVGDYVDRGPDSRSVVNEVVNMQKRGHVALMGNHEDMLTSGELLYAGETLDSYGGSVPDSVLEWMRSLPKYYEDSTVIVAHAGVKPGIPMDQQTDMFLLWYRYQQGGAAFMDRHFYHGHTPMLGKIESVVDRTNVDTACVYGGHLTAAIVGEDGRPEGFLQVAARDSAYR